MSCDRKIGPFDCCSVVQGDCLELMKQLPDGCVDAVITDPPYGMSLNTDYSGMNGWSGKGKKHERIHGDDRPFDPTPFLRFKTVVLWGANFYASHLPDNGGWIVWNKRGDGAPSEICFGDCELAWTNRGQSVRMYSQMWHGIARWTAEPSYHPTQKPVALMEWTVARYTEEGQTILDPFSGSGPLSVAAKKLCRHFLGFEISPEYCEIARKRIALVEAQPTLFEPKAIQEELGL